MLLGPSEPWTKTLGKGRLSVFSIPGSAWTRVPDKDQLPVLRALLATRLEQY